MPLPAGNLRNHLGAKLHINITMPNSALPSSTLTTNLTLPPLPSSLPYPTPAPYPTLTSDPTPYPLPPTLPRGAARLPKPLY